MLCSPLYCTLHSMLYAVALHHCKTNLVVGCAIGSGSHKEMKVCVDALHELNGSDGAAANT